MNRKTVFRNLAIAAAILLALWAFLHFSDDTRGYKAVDTSVALAQISSSNVEDAEMDDKEQQLRLTLKNAADGTDGETKIIAKYPTGASLQIFNDINNAKPTKFDTTVTPVSYTHLTLPTIYSV